MPINELNEKSELELVCVIVNKGMGSKVLHIARHHGLTGGTVLLGKGTINNRLLDTLALADIRKEIVLLLTKRSADFSIIEIIYKELKLHKPNHGIAFSIPVTGVVGSKCFPNEGFITNGGSEKTMFQSIIIIVDKGRGETAVEAAREAGSTGATIINARGAGIHETSRLFSMEIEPEKELVLIIVKESQTECVMASLRTYLDIDKAGNGIIFVQNVNQTYGLYE